MPRGPREQSDANIYHVIQRGTNQQAIFRDDSDRRHFLRLLKTIVDTTDSTIYAWVLMGNHVHLLIKQDLAILSNAMQWLFSTYVLYFNKRYERRGTLLQGRFTSVPIASEEQFLATVRYIHQNPLKAGMSSSCNYHWSSFKEYSERPWIVDTALLHELIGGSHMLAIFHSQETTSADAGIASLPDEAHTGDVGVMVANLLSELNANSLSDLGKAGKKELVCELRAQGVPVTLIGQVTGISKSTIYRLLE